MPRGNETFASYVPALIARQFSAQSAPPTEPRAEVYSGAVLFADISGFTALTEALACHGAFGAEQLTQCLNVYFGQLIDLITGHGGDVIKFAGDGLLALWPTGADDLPTATCRATQCALAAQKQLHNFRAAADVRLSLRIGIGAGPMSLLHVGGVHGRWELVATGASLTQMGAAKDGAQPGEVSLSAEAWALIRDRAEGRPLPSGTVRIESLRPEYLPDPPPPPLPPGDAAALLAYVPRIVVHHLESGQSGWLGELRPVSVIFVNFPGLTPETPLDRAQLVMRDLQAILHRYEATINKISVDDKGASLIAAMGLPPLAHEDNAARAVAVALAMRDRLREIQVRHAIGIASGLTFCGVVGNDIRREYTMMGDAVNLSARLMQAAPDDVLCDQATHDASRSRQAFEALPAIRVKGKAKPINVYRPLAGRVQTDAVRDDKAAAIVGRLAERRAIAETLRALGSSGTGATVVIEGEAGIGKTRLMQELIERARDAGVNTLAGAGDAIEGATAYYPWRAIFFQLFGLEMGGSKAERAARVEARLGETGHPEWIELLPLLNPVLLNNWVETGATQSMNDRDRASAAQNLLADLLVNLPQPGSRTVLIVDNAHWMDSASWKLAVVVIQRRGPLVAVFSVRPITGSGLDEFDTICRAPGTQRIRLQPLSADEAIDVARGALGVAQLPEPVQKVIHLKAEGNPLFIEELVNALRDRELIQIAGGECRLAPAAGDLQSVDLPDTVQGAVMARIDRLSASQRMLLKVASVIGRVFEAAVLQSLNPAGADPAAITEDLGALAAMQITALHRAGPAPVYAFSQLIFQEVNYNLMLFSQRRQLHRAMAEQLERANLRHLEAVYPLLAAHYSKAVGEDDAEPALVWKAVEYLQKAGEQAVRQYANREAVAFFSEGLRLLERLPDTVERAQKELTFCCAIGSPLLVTKGFAAPETERAYARAWELCKQVDENTPERFGVVSGLWGFYLVKTELRRARELAAELLQLANASGDTELLLPAHRALGETSFWLGEQATARDHLDSAIALYRSELHHASSVARNGQDTGVVCRGQFAWAHWMLGYPDTALGGMEDALALARKLSHPFSVAIALLSFVLTHQFRREPSATLEKAEEVIALSQDQGFPLWLAGGTIMRGWALSELGQADLGRAEMQRGLDNWRATGAELTVGYYSSLLANAYGAAGQPQKGLDIIRGALAASHSSGESWWRPELWRAHAELSLALPRPDEADAERCLLEALFLARRQQARSLELRAAIGLFRIWSAQGRLEQAHRCLRAVTDWFTEGRETADYKEATRLLAANPIGST